MELQWKETAECIAGRVLFHCRTEDSWVSLVTACWDIAGACLLECSQLAVELVVEDLCIRCRLGISGDFPDNLTLETAGFPDLVEKVAGCLGTGRLLDIVDFLRDQAVEN